MELSNNCAKALLLRYRTLKNSDDPDPNVVFRPREREYITRKKVSSSGVTNVARRDVVACCADEEERQEVLPEDGRPATKF